MPEKYNHKYRIQSCRLQSWDYGHNAPYFITICTHGRNHYFGEIADRKMILSEIGKYAWACWFEIPKHFPFVLLDAFVVMPNHIHGIIIIDKPVETQDIASPTTANVKVNANVDTQDIASPITANVKVNANVDTQDIASPTTANVNANIDTQNIAYLHLTKSKNRFGPQSRNLASIIRGYKIGVTKCARNNNHEFQWQSRYHDHIIRNEISFDTIRNYINCNPKKWKTDKFNNT